MSAAAPAVTSSCRRLQAAAPRGRPGDPAGLTEPPTGAPRGTSGIRLEGSHSRGVTTPGQKAHLRVHVPATPIAGATIHAPKKTKAQKKKREDFGGSAREMTGDQASTKKPRVHHKTKHTPTLGPAA